MSAAMFSMGERISLARGHGMLEQLRVKGERGRRLGMRAGTHSFLISLVKREAKLGRILFDLNKAAGRVKNAIF